MTGPNVQLMYLMWVVIGTSLILTIPLVRDFPGRMPHGSAPRVSLMSQGWRTPCWPFRHLLINRNNRNLLALHTFVTPARYANAVLSCVDDVFWILTSPPPPLTVVAFSVTNNATVFAVVSVLDAIRFPTTLRTRWYRIINACCHDV